MKELDEWDLYGVLFWVIVANFVALGWYSL